ncbi:N-acetylmuramoyl-L-alanine amidase [Amycolatopsis marina]|uniref:N-acetylmuramoyl-L-alanine amidase n=1 Tax=Amycolatopsis marina TaxID=490629 RepID=A0A1I0V5P7_9PSEU|nr:N-acetylmuramoyl-L-alanine amidase [Amycolatopsis marina]SFA71655.1 N-acetylmuramoyl-L-alanine amidase [Amycolatopsis marina]
MWGRGVLVAVLGSVLLAACGAESAGTAPTPAPTSTESSGESARPTTMSPTTTTTTSVRKPPASVVVLDPGHNGGNAVAPGEINRKVPAGRDRTKACNTTGTSTDEGFGEHAFNFDVAQRVGDILTARGVRVIFTRDNDTGVGPCVDERARIGNDNAADAVVSIHADGATAPGARGFHIAYSAPPLNQAQERPTRTLARDLRDGLRAAGFPLSNYVGEDGFSPRDDLGGMNLSTRPSVLVECGNMRDTGEAAAMSTPDGRQRYAAAIAEGITTYLVG